MKTSTRSSQGDRQPSARTFRWTLKSIPQPQELARAAIDGSNDCGGCDCAGCAVTPAPLARARRAGRAQR